MAETDELGNATRFEYDLAGQLVKISYPDGSSIANAYDNLGRRIAATGERGGITRYEYEPAGLRPHHEDDRTREATWCGIRTMRSAV